MRLWTPVRVRCHGFRREVDTLVDSKAVVMKTLLIVVGALLTLAGLLWTMQGLGYLGGSVMTGESTWAIVGPIVAGLGVALLYVALRGGGTRSR